MRVLVLDNYDSFTYNLVHIIRSNKCTYEVYRNDKIELNEVKRFDKILISPGPGLPGEAGILKSLIKEYAPTKSILGVCLGHQAIAEVFGGTLYNLPSVLHGVTTKTNVIDFDEPIFKSLPPTFEVCHYHSWVVEQPLPEVLKVTSQNEGGLVMGLRHARFDVAGLQFHPESIMTPQGPQIIKNWLEQ